MRSKAHSFYSKVISFFLVLLGFTPCNSETSGENGSIAEYGVPTATFRIRGVLVDKADDSKFISGIKVAIGHPYLGISESKRTFYVDSIVTNNKGEFDLSISSFPASQKFVIKYGDTDAVQNGNYGLIIDTVRFENPSFTGERAHWSVGETTKDLDKVKLSLITDKK